MTSQCRYPQARPASDFSLAGCKNCSREHLPQACTPVPVPRSRTFPANSAVQNVALETACKESRVGIVGRLCLLMVNSRALEAPAAMVLLGRRTLPVWLRWRRARTRRTLLSRRRRRFTRLALRTALVIAALVRVRSVLVSTVSSILRRVRPVLISAIRVVLRWIKRPESVVIATVHVIVAALIWRRSVALVRRRERTESFIPSIRVGRCRTTRVRPTVRRG